MKGKAIVTLLLAFIAGFILMMEQSSIQEAYRTAQAKRALKSHLIELNSQSFTPFYQSYLQRHIEVALQSPGSYLEKSRCWAPDTDPRVVEKFYRIEHDLQHSLGVAMNRYQAGDADRWSSTVNSGSGLGQGDPTILSWSYVPDGTTITSDCNDESSTSGFIAFFNDVFGEPTTPGDFTTAPWHTLFIDMFEIWSEVSGLSFVYEPNDDGANFPFTAGAAGVRGDHRIGGNFIDGNSNVLACNYFPNSGDMIIDTGDNFYENSSNLAVLNVLQHEIGHGLGISHVCPVNETKLMEPFVTTAFAGPQEDDILAVNRLYGDAEENNNSSTTATDLGSLVLPSLTTRDTLSIDDNSDIDYFEFNIANAADIEITLSNTGSTYLEGAQNANGSCQPGTSYDPSNFANLEMDLLASDGSTVLASADANGTGVDEVISTSIGAGTFYLRIQQTGSVNEVQMYQYVIDLDPIAVNPPTASFTASDDGPIDLCLGTTVAIDFMDTSTDFPDTWDWTFTGAGVSPGTSTEQFPSVTVSASGTLSVSLVASNSAGTSSNTATQDIEINALPLEDPSCEGGCFDLNNLDLTNDNITLITSSNGGYVSGSNGYNDESKVEEFVLSANGLCTPSEITGITICAVVDAGTSGNLTVGVWDDDGTSGEPGTLLGSTTVDVNSLAWTDTDGDENVDIPSECAYVDLSGSPISVSSDRIYVGISGLMSLSGGDMGILTNSDGEQNPTTAWEEWSNGDWFRYDNGSSWGLEIGHAVFPEFKPDLPTVDINVPDPPEGFCNDGTAYTFSENSSLCTQGAGTTESYVWTVSTAGQVVATGDAASEDFSFASAGDHEIELCVIGVSCEVNCTTATVVVADCGGCPTDYAGPNALTGVEDGVVTYETDGAIESTQTIGSNADVTYDAGSTITLNESFEVTSGALFEAMIDGCGQNAMDGTMDQLLQRVLMTLSAEEDRNFQVPNVFTIESRRRAFSKGRSR